MKIMITAKPIEAIKLFSILNLIPLSPTCQTFLYICHSSSPTSSVYVAQYVCKRGILCRLLIVCVMPHIVFGNLPTFAPILH